MTEPNAQTTSDAEAVSDPKTGSNAQTKGPIRAHLTGIALMALVLAGWSVLAIRQPELTYHFAPLIAALAWPVATRRQNPIPMRTAAATGLGSFVVVSAVSIALDLGDYMEGPTFVHSRPALTEAILFAAIGAGFGTRVATRAKAGVIGELFK